MRHHANRLISITPRMPVPTAAGPPNGGSSSNGSSTNSVVDVVGVVVGGAVMLIGGINSTGISVVEGAINVVVVASIVTVRVVFETA